MKTILVVLALASSCVNAGQSAAELKAIREAAQKAYDDLPQAEKDRLKREKDDFLTSILGEWKFAPIERRGETFTPAGTVSISTTAYKVTTPEGTRASNPVTIDDLDFILER